MTETSTYIDIKVSVEVDFDFYPRTRGARDSLGGRPGAGPPLEPDEPAHVEIVAVRVGKTDILNDLSSDELNDLEQRVLDAALEEADDAPNDEPLNRD